jgi:UDP-2,3-diacylglucosamine hydrolase
LLLETLAPNRKIYFASDVHLGLHPIEKSREREKVFVRWLDEIASDADSIYLLGDIFDYWYEYCKVVPRGFTRTLGKLSELCDRGIKIHYFTGNHDVWVFDYLPSETGMIIHHEPYIMEVNGLRFFLAHGDGLGPGDIGYKLLKAIFHSRVLQWLYSRIHPNGSMAFAHWWSKKSRYSKGVAEAFLGEENEHQVLFSRKVLQEEHFDFFVFGHRHVPMDIPLNYNSRLINLGEWIFANTYAVFDGYEMQLKSFHGSSHP